MTHDAQTSNNGHLNAAMRVRELLIDLADAIGAMVEPAVGSYAAQSVRFDSTCHRCSEPIAWVKTERNHEWAALCDKPGPYAVMNGLARWIGDAGQYAFHYSECGDAAPREISDVSVFDRLKATGELVQQDPDRRVADKVTRKAQ